MVRYSIFYGRLTYVPIFLLSLFILFTLPKDFCLENARFTLSSIIQGEAAIFGVVITLSIISFQIASSRYSTIVIRIFTSSIDFLLISSVYVFSILIAIFTLQWNLTYKFLNLTYSLAIFCVISLIPYTINTINLVNPITLIKQLTKGITKQKLIDGDPVSPIKIIIEESIENNDYDKINKGLDLVITKVNRVIKEEFISRDSRGSISVDKVYHNLDLLSDKVIEKKQWAIIISLIKKLRDLAISSMEKDLPYISAVERIRNLYQKVTGWNNHFIKVATIHVLRDIGDKSIEKRKRDILTQVIDLINVVGRDIEFQNRGNEVTYHLEELRQAATGIRNFSSIIQQINGIIHDLLEEDSQT